MIRLPKKILQLIWIHRDLPDPDLFIRTSGETRISNYMMWQLAYTEIYITDVLWPDFDDRELDAALRFYAHKDRRYGRGKKLDLLNNSEYGKYRRLRRIGVR